MKVWSLLISVPECAYEAKSGRYEPWATFMHSCFCKGNLWENSVGKSTKQTFMSRIDPRISNSLCIHVPSQRGYLLHPVSSFFFSTRSSLKFYKRKLSQFRISRFKRHGRVQLPHGKRLFDVVCRCHRVWVLIDTGIAWHCQGTSDMVLMNATWFAHWSFSFVFYC